MINIKVDTSGLTAMADELQHLDLKPAISRALNRAGDMATTQVGRTLAAETGTGVRQVRESISVSRATPADLTYEIAVSGRHIPLSEFAPRETRKGVSARPWGVRRTFGGAFIIGEDVVARQVRERLPLRRLYGPSLPVEAERGQSFKVALELAQEVFERRLQHEVGRALKGSKG
jgi:hypothetical protein